MLENQELESGPFILSLWEVLHEWRLHKREPLQLDGSAPRWKALFCLPWFWVKILPETKLVLHHRIHLLSTGGRSLPIQQRVKQLKTARNRNPLLTLQVSHFEDAFFLGHATSKKTENFVAFLLPPSWMTFCPNYKQGQSNRKQAESDCKASSPSSS